MSPQHDLNLIRELEEELFKPTVCTSKSAVSDLLADDFVEFGRSGRVYGKREVVSGLAAESGNRQERINATDFTLKSLSDNVVLLTYRSHRFDGEKALHTLRSSIWRYAEGSWKMVFHQGTPTNGN